MRVVDYEKDTSSVTCQVLKGLGVVSGLLALVVCVLIIANNLSLKKSDPIHAPALQKLLLELKADPQNKALQEEIRELDFLARKAFFTSQHFNRVGIYILLGSLIVMMIAFKSLQAYSHRPPYPNSKDPKDDLPEQARWARQSITAMGLILAGLALALALPWQSPLDQVSSLDSLPSESSDTQSEVPSASPSVLRPIVPNFPSREEQLANWPTFLGAATGQATLSDPPVDWDGETGRGIAWKQPVPKPGFSSPIVWNQRIFISGADEFSREIFCYDAARGELLWQQQVKDIPGSPATAPEVNGDTGYAASTMVTDGQHICAIFANGDLAAFDMEGHPVWSQSLGLPENHYGHSSSLAIYQDILLVQFDQKKNSFLLGLEVSTGKVRWKAARNFGTSWASPILTEVNGQPQVILAANPMITAYEPGTGHELWQVSCLPKAEVAPSPVHADGRVYVASDYDKFAAIDIASKSVLWKHDEHIPGVSTPVVSHGLLFSGLADGGIACWDAATGEEVWFQETDEGFYASPILANGRVYLMDRSGIMHIFAASREFKSLGQPSLGERSVCTPAMVGNHIYYRGANHLFKIGT